MDPIDLSRLPEPVRRYLTVTGAARLPPVRSFALRFRGRIRGAPSAAWMSFTAEQRSVIDPPSRHFEMHASKLGVPLKAIHRFHNGVATMRVRVAGLVTLVDAHGPVLDRSETVTHFNDLCLLAPGALADRRIAWDPEGDPDGLIARARFTCGAQTIAATLQFDRQGRLTNFVSDDRSRAAPNGRDFTPLRFSTPVRDYRHYGALHLASYGEAHWHAAEPAGEFVYGEFELLDIHYGGASDR